MENEMTKAAFTFLKDEMLEALSKKKNKSLISTLDMDKDGLLSDKKALLEVITSAVISPTHASTLKFLLESCDSLSQFICVYTMYLKMYLELSTKYDEKQINELMSSSILQKLIKLL
jgi:hypothetical protein